MALDLADLKSIRRCADAVRGAHPALHGLINNAGVMAIPYRRTADGFEMQFGTNHLGHFALTGLLLDRLLATPGARVVTVSSNAHKFAAMRWDDLQWTRGYRKWFAYSQSKLANLLFANELQRRLAAANAGAISVACHPGYAATNLQGVGPRMQGSSIGEVVMEFANRVFAQNAAMGALPTLYAATAPDVRGGDYIGPDGLGEQWGHPKKVRANARANDPEAQRRLWEASERLTGVRYGALH
jgi:NAD(P)-dependent dehydrogenase (short-subunit alcohol dehydrogenase family)